MAAAFGADHLPVDSPVGRLRIHKIAALEDYHRLADHTLAHNSAENLTGSKEVRGKAQDLGLELLAYRNNRMDQNVEVFVPNHYHIHHF